MKYEPQDIPEGGTVNVYVWTDYVCPFCLLGERFIRQAIDGTAARMVWMPFELRPFPMPTLQADDEYLAREWEQAVYPMARRLGVPIRLPTVSPQPYTRKAFIGLQYAMEQGLGNAYTEAVLGAFFQHDRDVGDIRVLTELAAAVGLDRVAYVHALEDAEYARRHDESLTLARQLGIQAVPSALIGKRLVTGVSEDVDALRQLVREARVNLLH